MDTSKFNKQFIASGYESVSKFLEDLENGIIQEDGEASASPSTVSTQFSTTNKPEHSFKKSEIEEDEENLEQNEIEDGVVSRTRNSQGDL